MQPYTDGRLKTHTDGPPPLRSLQQHAAWSPATSPMCDVAAECCLGGQLKLVGTPHQADCEPGFVPGQPHLQDKFCKPCCMKGFAVSCSLVRVLGAHARSRYKNTTREGFWNKSGPCPPFRVLNQHLRCVGSALIMFCEAPSDESDDWSQLPESLVAEGGVVWLRVAYGTLIPVLRRKERGGHKKVWAALGDTEGSPTEGLVPMPTSITPLLNDEDSLPSDISRASYSDSSSPPASQPSPALDSLGMGADLLEDCRLFGEGGWDLLEELGFDRGFDEREGFCSLLAPTGDEAALEETDATEAGASSAKRPRHTDAAAEEEGELAGAATEQEGPLPHGKASTHVADAMSGELPPQSSVKEGFHSLPLAHSMVLPVTWAIPFSEPSALPMAPCLSAEASAAGLTPPASMPAPVPAPMPASSMLPASSMPAPMQGLICQPSAQEQRPPLYGQAMPPSEPPCGPLPSHNLLSRPCTACREAKIRCNRAAPVCQRCEHLGIPCFLPANVKRGRPSNADKKTKLAAAAAQAVSSAADIVRSVVNLPRSPMPWSPPTSPPEPAKHMPDELYPAGALRSRRLLFAKGFVLAIFVLIMASDRTFATTSSSTTATEPTAAGYKAPLISGAVRGMAWPNFNNSSSSSSSDAMTNTTDELPWERARASMLAVMRGIANIASMDSVKLSAPTLAAFLLSSAVFPGEPPKWFLPYVHAIGAAMVASRVRSTVNRYRHVPHLEESEVALTIRHATLIASLLGAVARAVAISLSRGRLFWPSNRLLAAYNGVLLLVVDAALWSVERPSSYPPTDTPLAESLVVACSFLVQACVFTPRNRRRLADFVAAAGKRGPAETCSV